MKKLLISIGVTVALFLIAYLLGAFANASFDMTTWEPTGRAFIAFFLATILIAVHVTNEDIS